MALPLLYIEQMRCLEILRDQKGKPLNFWTLYDLVNGSGGMRDFWRLIELGLIEIRNPDSESREIAGNSKVVITPKGMKLLEKGIY